MKDVIIKYRNFAVFSLFFVLITYSFQYVIILKDLNINFYLFTTFIRFAFTAVLVFFVLRKNMILKSFKIKRLSVVRTLWLIIAYMIIQSLLLGNFRSLLTLPKYIFYFSSITLAIDYYNQERSYFVLNNILKRILLIFYLIMVLYLITFLINPTFEYRYYRPEVFLGNANEDGGLLSCLFPFVLYTISVKFKIKQLLIIAIYFVFLYFLNGTRTTLISSFIVLFVFVFFSKSRFSTKWSKFFIVSILIALIFYVIANLNFKSIFLEDDAYKVSNIAEIWEKEQGRGTLAGRIAGIWAPVTKYTIRESPILGFGNASWSDITDKLRLSLDTNEGKSSGRSSHNFWLSVFVELGLIGIFLFLSIFVSSIKRIIRLLIYLRDTVSRNFLLALLCSWFSFILWGLTANAFSVPGFIVFSVLLILTFTFPEYKIKKPTNY